MGASLRVLFPASVGLGIALGMPASVVEAADPSAYVVPPVPNREHKPEKLHLGTSVHDLERGRLGDEPIDAQVTRLQVEIDLYPDVVGVRTFMAFETGPRGAKELVVGFPEELPGSPAMTADDLVVRFDGTLLEPGFSGIWMNGFDLAGNAVGGPHAEELAAERDAAWGRSLWWSWPMDLDENATHELEVTQTLTNTADEGAGTAEGTRRQSFTYAARTLALWKGPIGELELRVRTHGIDAESIRIESELGMRSTEGEDIVWRINGMEPARHLRLSYDVPDGFAPEGEVVATHHMAIDALSMVRGASKPAQWTSYVESLHAQRADGGPTAAAADRILSQLATLVATLDDPGVEAALAWLEASPAADRPDSCKRPGDLVGEYGHPIDIACRIGALGRLAPAASQQNLHALVAAAQPAGGSRRNIAIAGGVLLAAVGSFFALRRRRRT